MRRRSTIGIIILVLLVSIGFAAVTTNLLYNGQSTISIGNYDVFFDNAQIYNESGEGSVTISNDKKTMTFTTNTLTNDDEMFTLMYNVANDSSDYDARVTFNYNFLSGSEYEDYFEIIFAQLDNLYDDDIHMMEKNDTFIIPAKETKQFGFGIRLKQAVLENQSIELQITYDTEAIERDSKVESDYDALKKYFDKEPGLYTLDMQQTKTWQELLDDGIIHVDDGVLYTGDNINYETYEEIIEEKTYTENGSYDSDELFDYLITEMTRKNTSCSSLNGILVVDSSISKIESFNLMCSGLKGVVILNDNYLNYGNFEENMMGIAFTPALYSKNAIISSMDQYRSMEYTIEYGISSINPVIEDEWALRTKDHTIVTAYLGDSTDVVVPEGITSIEGIPFVFSKVSSVTLPSTLKEIGPYAFAIKYINTQIPDSVETIGDGAFYNNTKMIKSIVLPEGLKNIGEDAFYTYSKDDDEQIVLNIPSSVENIGYDAFRGIDIVYYEGPATYEDGNKNWGAKLLNPYVDGDFIYSGSAKEILTKYTGASTDVIIPNGVKTILEGCFDDIKLTSVLLPDTLETIEDYVFANTSITSIDVPSSVTKIGHNAFLDILNVNYEGPATYEDDNKNWGARYLNSIVENDFVLSADRTIARKYIGESKDVVIPNGVKRIESHCFDSNLNSLTLPDSLEIIDEYGLSRTYLDSVTIPSSVVEIGYHAFDSIRNVDYRGTATYSETDLYWGAKYINTIEINNYVLSEDQTTLYDYIGSGYTLNIPNTVTTIAPSAFKSKYYPSINIPESVTVIGEYAFASCSTNSITIPSSVVEIGYHAFYKVGDLVYNGPATYSSDDEFWGAKKMNGGYIEDGLIYTDSTKVKLAGIYGSFKDLIVPEGVKTIGIEALEYQNFDSVQLPSTLTNILEEAFYWCKIHSVLVIPNSVTTIGDYAFDSVRAVEYHGTATDRYNWEATAFNAYVDGDYVYKDSSMRQFISYLGHEENVILPNTVESIGEQAFFYTEGHTISIPNSVFRIENYAFEFSNYDTITLPNGLSSLGGAFWFARFKEIILPSSMNSLPNGAFNYTDRLERVYIPSSITIINNDIFSNAYNFDSTVTLDFEVKEGWKVKKDDIVIDIPASDFDDMEKLNTYFKDTYKDYIWTRE